MKVLALCVVLAVLAGCSDSKQHIADASRVVIVEATQASDALARAIRSGDVGPKAKPAIEEAQARMPVILAAAGDIQDELPNIQNTDGWLTRFFKRAVTGLVVAGIIAVSVYIGWPLLPLFIGWLIRKIPRLFCAIPRGIRGQAKLDFEALRTAPSDSPLYESVAVRRTKSPLYEAAFLKAKTDSSPGA